MNLKIELKKRAEIFNKYWKKYLQQAEPKTLYDASRHLPLAGGKRLRPFLAMVACESISGDHKKALQFSAALEIVNNFTLVHDDIMDKSKLRRNIPTVHIKYGEPTAILAGDLLFAKAFEAIHDLTTDYSIFKELDYDLVKCIIEICEGQQLDMGFEKRKTVTEKEYIEMIQKKTAALFRVSSKGGAIIGNGTKEEIQALTDYGNLLGLGFQIWDDYLDISSDENILGKDIGNDIRNGKKTLIAVHALEHANGKDKQLLDDIFGNKNASENDIKKVLELFKKVGSIEYAKNTALDYNRKAKQSLKILKNSEAKRILEELADFSIKREK
jgi:geranylgeranyl diphosphate synthase type I